MTALPGVQLAFASAAGIIAARATPWGAGVWVALALLAGLVAVFAAGAFSNSEAPEDSRPLDPKPPTDPRSSAGAGPVRGWRVRLAGATPLLTAGAAMAAWYLAWTGGLPADNIGRIAEHDWQPVVLRAVVVSSPERRPNALAMLRGGTKQPEFQSVVDLQVRGVRFSDRWNAVSGTVRATINGDISDRLVGDQVLAYGQLRRIEGPRNPGAVDMRAVYAVRGITARLRVDAASQFVLESPGAWGPRRVLSWLGTVGERTLHRYVGEDAGPLTAALVLGRRQAIDRGMRDALVETGTVHLLSVSGMHLSMVAGVVAGLMVLSGSSRGWQVFSVVGVCIFYAALTGANPPVLRAAMLVGALLIGSWAGKQASMFNSLGLAAVVLMILNPHNLLQTGTQLSFVAVIALVIAGRKVLETLGDDDPLDALLHASRPWVIRKLVLQWRRARRFTFISFWVWAATAPLVWQAYKIVAPISVLANLLIVVPLTVAMISGILTAAVGLLLGPLAIPLGLICRGCIEAMRVVVDWMANVPCGHFWLPPPPLWWVILFYVVIVTAAVLPARFGLAEKRRVRWLVLWMVGWMVAAVPLATYRAGGEGSLAVTFVDVGHGTSALIELPDGGVWLYDAGALGDPRWSAQPIQDVLWSRGIWHLDGIIVSHADADHYNAIPGLLQRFHVSSIVAPPGMLAQRQRGLDPVREAIAHSGVQVVERSEGMGLRGRDGRVWGRFLHPPPVRLEGSDNANSLVLRIDHQGTTILLPGDLEMPGSEHLLRHSRPPPGGMLMAPHHGSLQEDARTLLDWMRPAVVVVSGGKRSLRPEVREMLAQGGADVHLTAAEGAVRIEVDREGKLTARGFR